ncbi:MAG: hypothetical protein QM715_20945 [Nibricoccus sp.]
MKLRFLVIVLASVLSLAVARADVPQLAKLKAAAEAGDPQAQYNFAKTFGPLGADWTKWLSASAAQGFGPAEDELAWTSNWAIFKITFPDAKMRNIHLKNNSAKMRQALLYASSAADKGFGRSRLILAMAYANGYGVQQDMVEAYKWAKLSASTDLIANVVESSERDRLLKTMPLQQVKEGEARAALFRPGNTAQEIYRAMVVPHLKLIGAVSSNGEIPGTAIVSGKTIKVGEEKQIDINGLPVRMRCIRIEKTGVTIALLPSETQYLLRPNAPAEIIR